MSLRASCLMLKNKCYEAKIGESEKSWQSPGVEPRVRLPATTSFFHFPYFCLTTSRFIYNYVHINVLTKINYD